MNIKEALEVLNENIELGGHIGESLNEIVAASRGQKAKLKKAALLASKEFGTRELENALDVIDLIKDSVISN